MSSLLTTPLDAWLAERWRRIAPAQKIGLLVAACVSVLAFGFEMTNLTLHHDDLNHLMVQKPLVGYYLGRFVHAWLFWYGQQGLFLPFLDMTIGMALMGGYGVLVAHFWGARRAPDVALVAAIVCVFPYMAHIYQYNSAMVAYPLAHLAAAGGVVLAARARAVAVAAGALLLFVAFSIYQAVLANAVTLLLVWLLMQLLFVREPTHGATNTAAGPSIRSTAWPVGCMLLAIGAGGLLHVLTVWALGVPFDSAQGADEAFSLSSRLEHGLRLATAASAVLQGSRAFFVWPEAYLPLSIKGLHALLLAGAALCCVLVPRGLAAKAAALALLALIVLAPRTLQLMHPQGTFHKLTLTGYALVVAGAALVIVRSTGTALRNLTFAACAVLVAGYVVQCHWVSVVNHLNTQAHMSTVTQILARVRSLPAPNWDGRTIIVVGRYDMPKQFPFRPATGVASEFLGARHMNFMARLLRDEARFVAIEPALEDLQAAAQSRPAWPHPESVGVVGGQVFVVLGHSSARD